jgi:hypothetical protein
MVALLLLRVHQDVVASSACNCRSIRHTRDDDTVVYRCPASRQLCTV